MQRLLLLRLVIMYFILNTYIWNWKEWQENLLIHMGKHKTTQNLENSAFFVDKP